MSNILDYYKPRIKKAQSPTPYGSPPLFSREPKKYTPLRAEDSAIFRQHNRESPIARMKRYGYTTDELNIPKEFGGRTKVSPAQVAAFYYGKDLADVYRKARENLRKYKTPQEAGFPKWYLNKFMEPVDLTSLPVSEATLETIGMPGLKGFIKTPNTKNDYLPKEVTIVDPEQVGEFTPDMLPFRNPDTLSHETVHAMTSDKSTIGTLPYGYKTFNDKYLDYIGSLNELDARLANLKRYAYRMGIHLDTPEKTKKFLDVLSLIRPMVGLEEISDEERKHLADTLSSIQDTKKFEEFGRPKLRKSQYILNQPGDAVDLLQFIDYVEKNIPEPQKSKLLKAIYERATQLVKNNNQQRVLG